MEYYKTRIKFQYKLLWFIIKIKYHQFKIYNIHLNSENTFKAKKDIADFTS